MLDGLKFDSDSGLFYNFFPHFWYFKKLKFGLKISFTSDFLLNAQKFFVETKWPHTATQLRKNLYDSQKKLGMSIR
jgi:hypothetical protein